MVVPIARRGYVDQKQLALGVARAVTALAPDVVRIRFNLGEDWVGAPAIFFRVVLSNSASKRPNLSEVSRRVSHEILREIDVEESGLNPYFNFRSLSEQAEMKEAEWD